MLRIASFCAACTAALTLAAVPADAHTKRKKHSLPPPAVHINVDLSTQDMNVIVDGRHIATWDVSTGKAGHRTPRGSWRINRMARVHYSKQFNNAPLPHAMFFVGGVAIHATKGVHKLGTAASHGCVRLSPEHAAKLYGIVKRYGMKRALVTVSN